MRPGDGVAVSAVSARMISAAGRAVPALSRLSGRGRGRCPLGPPGLTPGGISAKKKDRVGPVDDRHARGLPKPFCLDLGQPAALAQACQPGIHAFPQRGFLFHERAEKVGVLGAVGRALAEDDAVLQTDGRQVERGGQVEERRVDLAGLHGGGDIGVVAVKQRVALGPDQLGQHRNGGGVGVGAPDQTPETVDGGGGARLHDPLRGQDRHGRGVVGL